MRIWYVMLHKSRRRCVCLYSHRGHRCHTTHRIRSLTRPNQVRPSQSKHRHHRNMALCTPTTCTLRNRQRKYYIHVTSSVTERVSKYPLSLEHEDSYSTYDHPHRYPKYISRLSAGILFGSKSAKINHMLLSKSTIVDIISFSARHHELRTVVIVTNFGHHSPPCPGAHGESMLGQQHTRNRVWATNTIAAPLLFSQGGYLFWPE